MKPIGKKRFISFEGIDFSGKSTQITLLKAYLEEKGFKVYVLREPGGTVISEKIRNILLDSRHNNMNERSEIFLYSAARAQLVFEKIIPLLKEGYFVIADRYVDSTTAYQGYGRGIDPQLVRMINNMATFNLLPAITFLLDLTPQQAFVRRTAGNRQADRLEASGDAFFKRIYSGYHQMAEIEKERFFIIDAQKSVEEIHKQIIQIILSKIVGKKDE